MLPADLPERGAVGRSLELKDDDQADDREDDDHDEEDIAAWKDSLPRHRMP